MLSRPSGRAAPRAVPLDGLGGAKLEGCCCAPIGRRRRLQHGEGLSRLRDLLLRLLHLRRFVRRPRRRSAADAVVLLRLLLGDLRRLDLEELLRECRLPRPGPRALDRALLADRPRALDFERHAHRGRARPRRRRPHLGLLLQYDQAALRLGPDRRREARGIRGEPRAMARVRSVDARPAAPSCFARRVSGTLVAPAGTASASRSASTTAARSGKQTKETLDHCVHSWEGRGGARSSPRRGRT